VKRLAILLLLLLSATPVDARPFIDLRVGFEVPIHHLGPTPAVSVDAGWRVWKGLAPFVAVGYAAPSADDSGSSTQVGGGGYTTTITQRDLSLTAGALWFFRPTAKKRLTLYAGGGLRLSFLTTIVDGMASTGMPFGENRESASAVGGAARFGCDARLGPGALGLELELAGAPYANRTTGDTSTTSLSFTVGYRLHI
jgi:hypothetical protein